MKRVSMWLKLSAVLVIVGALSGCALLNPAPVVNFSWNPFEPLARSSVQFTDQSTDAGFLGGGGIASWNWDFGDNETSSAQNPKHEYEQSGAYTVRLTVTDTAGKSASMQKTIHVAPSIDGRWSGSITDGNYRQWTLGLSLNHSSSGGITGTMTIGLQTQTINSAALDPDTGEVQIACSAFGMILRGDLSANETRMSGWWYDDWTGERWEDWTVTLQN